MHRQSAWILSGFCLALAACQAPSPTVAGAPVEVVSNAGLLTIPDCAAGMSASLSGGPQIEYLGSDPEDLHQLRVALHARELVLLLVHEGLDLEEDASAHGSGRRAMPYPRLARARSARWLLRAHGVRSS